MSHIQDKIPRDCAICEQPIIEFQLMFDLFRSRGGRVEWCHESCAQAAIERWLEKKRQKKEEAQAT